HPHIVPHRLLLSLIVTRPPTSTLFPYTTLFRSFSGKMLFSILPIGSDAVGKKVKINLRMVLNRVLGQASPLKEVVIGEEGATGIDRKSTRLNSSHVSISYAVFCLKKKKKIEA